MNRFLSLVTKKDFYGHQYSRCYMPFLINNLLMSIRANKFQGDTYLQKGEINLCTGFHRDLKTMFMESP